MVKIKIYTVAIYCTYVSEGKVFAFTSKKKAEEFFEQQLTSDIKYLFKPNNPEYFLSSEYSEEEFKSIEEYIEHARKYNRYIFYDTEQCVYYRTELIEHEVIKNSKDNN